MTAVKSRPIRSCVGCGGRKDKRELVRIVRSTEGVVSLDRTGRANGRGAYLCPDPLCLQKARKTKALERSLKAVIEPEVYEELTGQLKKG